MLRLRPQPLVRIPAPFDHPDWIFEVKHDGFRALAHIDGHRSRLESRNGHTFDRWPPLCEELAHAIRANRAVLDGEIVCLGPDGRSRFNDLLFRREWPYFYAFDLLMLDGEDLRDRPLLERKRGLQGIMPRVESRLRYVEHVNARGCDFYQVACQHDLEGIVGKLAGAPYNHDGEKTSWAKIKNPQYSQMEGRHELFERRGPTRRRRLQLPRLAVR